MPLSRQQIGRSKIVDCNGDTLAEAGVEEEELLIAAIDFQQANQNHIVNVAGAYELDRLGDRRPEMYQLIPQSEAGGKAQIASVGGE